MAVSRFTVEAVIRDYHVYKSLWLNPIMEEELSHDASGRLEMPKTLTLFLKVLHYRHFAHRTSGLLKRTI